MSCEECRELSTHAFRSAEDLVYAVRLATEEVDRGVLRRVGSRSLSPAEQEALDSSMASGALPSNLLYRFRCEVCGDHFTLQADTRSGQGGWTRQGPGDASGADPLPRSAGGSVLRRLAVSDLREFQAYRHDPLLGQYQDWSATSDAEASAFLDRMGTADLLRPGVWSQIGIADPDGLVLIGDVGLLLARDGRHAEIGFTLRRESHGHGIGAAAVRESINLVFEQTDAEEVLGITDARNLRSIRLLERVGMRMTESRAARARDGACVEYIYAVSRQHGG